MNLSTQYCPAARGLARSIGAVEVDHEGVCVRRRLLAVVGQDPRGILLRSLDPGLTN